MPTTTTVLNGTLTRRGPNDWQWSDGTPEPRVHDLSPDRWNFRSKTYACDMGADCKNSAHCVGGGQRGNQFGGARGIRVR
jgi:hypothetical protein